MVAQVVKKKQLSVFLEQRLSNFLRNYGQLFEKFWATCGKPYWKVSQNPPDILQNSNEYDENLPTIYATNAGDDSKFARLRFYWNAEASKQALNLHVDYMVSHKIAVSTKMQYSAVLNANRKYIWKNVVNCQNERTKNKYYSINLRWKSRAQNIRHMGTKQARLTPGLSLGHGRREGRRERGNRILLYIHAGKVITTWFHKLCKAVWVQTRLSTSRPLLCNERRSRETSSEMESGELSTCFTRWNLNLLLAIFIGKYD